MIAKLSELGITSEMAYSAGVVSIGLSVVSWVVSKKVEHADNTRDNARADRWGIYVGEWAPTFFALGVALHLEEKSK